MWASPEALRLQRASRADPILARDHDLWSFALVAFELFVGDASLTAKERAKPTGQGLRGLRPSEHLGSLYEGDVRQWSSAAVREWAGEKPKLDKIAKSFEEHGVDGAALLRYADDRPKLKADFKVTHGVAITLGMEMDRTVRRWPRPIPEDLVALLRKCVAVEPSERFESATPIVAELERLALAAHATIKAHQARAASASDDGVVAAAEGGGAARAPPPLSVATMIALPPEQADFHRDLGYALRTQLSRYDDSREHYTKAQGLYRAQRGDEDDEVENIENELSTLDFRQGDYPSARARNEKLLAAAEARHGPHDPKVASRCNNLAKVLVKLGEFDAARAACERALRIFALEGNDERAHWPALADAHKTMGSLHKTNGHNDGALEHLTRALELLEKVYGSEHPKYATVCKDVAEMLCFTDDKEKLRSAREKAEKAQHVFLHTRGKDHDATVKISCVLGWICSNEKQFGAADVHFGRGSSTQRRTASTASSCTSARTAVSS